MKHDSRWESDIEVGIGKLLDTLGLANAHIQNTPLRMAAALREAVSGYQFDPQEPLSTYFESTANEMVHIHRIRIVSSCSHHISPIIGVAHFAYIPKGRLAGLSKIPRFIDILSRRLQVQEELTAQIVDTFMGSSIRPAGCGIIIKAYHCCMITRGVREHESLTQTTGLRGRFTDPTVRAEFLAANDPSEVVF